MSIDTAQNITELYALELLKSVNILFNLVFIYESVLINSMVHIWTHYKFSSYGKKKVKTLSL